MFCIVSLEYALPYSGVGVDALRVSIWRRSVCSRVGACGCSIAAHCPEVPKARDLPLCRRLLWLRKVLLLASCILCLALVYVLCRPALLEHAVGCLARLLRLLLGKGALAEQKLEWGAGLCVLGVELILGQQGYSCRPAPGKVRRWLRDIRTALDSLELKPGLASKMAGRLQWTCQHMFQRVGRAMIRPIYDQQYSRYPCVSHCLCSCCRECCTGRER